jgi:hypothetical protein
MPSRFGDEPLAEIDLSKRYDIYVAEMGRRIVVYRGARFRGMRGLERSGRYDISSEFYEIEQANGDPLFIRRHAVLKFCEPGTRLVEEVVDPSPGKPPAA